MIKHNKTYLSQYAHLSRFAKGLKKGRKIKQGDLVGYVGSTGLSTGPHLDFRMQEGGTFVDPLKVLKSQKAVELHASEKAKFFSQVKIWRQERSRLAAGPGGSEG